MDVRGPPRNTEAQRKSESMNFIFAPVSCDSLEGAQKADIAGKLNWEGRGG